MSTAVDPSPTATAIVSKRRAQRLKCIACGHMLHEYCDPQFEWCECTCNLFGFRPHGGRLA